MYGHQNAPIGEKRAASHGTGETKHPQGATDLNGSETTHTPKPSQALPVVTITPPNAAPVKGVKGSGESFASASSSARFTAGTLTPRLTKEQLELYTPRKREKTTTTRIGLNDRGKAPGKWDVIEGDGLLKNIFQHVSVSSTMKIIFR
jgi:hypothetical protein